MGEATEKGKNAMSVTKDIERNDSDAINTDGAVRSRLAEVRPVGRPPWPGWLKRRPARAPGFVPVAWPVEGGLVIGESRVMTVNHTRGLEGIRGRLRPLAIAMWAWPGFLPLPGWAETAFSQAGCDFRVMFPVAPATETVEHKTGLVTTTAVHEDGDLRLSASCTAAYPEAWFENLSDAKLKDFILGVAEGAEIQVYSAERVPGADFRVFRVEGRTGADDQDQVVISYWAYGPQSRIIVEAVGRRTAVTGAAALRFFESLKPAGR